MYAKYVGYNLKVSQSFHVCNYWPIIGISCCFPSLTLMCRYHRQAEIKVNVTLRHAVILHSKKR